MAPIRLALILGSAREGRFCDTVAGWAASRIEQDGRYELDIVDTAAFSPVDTQEPGALRALSDRLAAADAFIVVTPEYNHSYPGVLKSLIDCFGDEWQAKPVAFVSYGGISGGLRAVEHLRQVFAELHAVGIRDTVSFAGAWNRFGPDGQLRDGREAEISMTRLLSRLAWWASALREARNEKAYGEAA